MSPASAIVVARDNKYGLTTDVEILKRALETRSVEVRVELPRGRRWIERLRARPVADCVFHLERVFPGWISAGRSNFLLPNQERFPVRHLRRLRMIDAVLAKSRHAEDIFARLGCDSRFVGFASPDRYSPDVGKDWNRFLHVAGASTLKGTEDLLALWAKNPHWPELVLVQKADNAPGTVPRNVRLVSGRPGDDDLRHLQNACGIHLCPSRAEGWGHYILEGMICAALVVTSDAPPMNEHLDETTGRLVRCGRGEPRHLGFTYRVDPQALAECIETLVRMPADEKAQIGARARQAAVALPDAFADRLAAACGL